MFDPHDGGLPAVAVAGGLPPFRRPRCITQRDLTGRGCEVERGGEPADRLATSRSGTQTLGGQVMGVDRFGVTEPRA